MMQPTVRQFHNRVDAVLSQYLIEHGKNFPYIDPTAFYQTGNQLNVTHRCIFNL